jgi:hypothetical protein
VEEYTSGVLSQCLNGLNTLLVQANDDSHLVAAVRDISIHRMPGIFLGTGSSDAFGLDTLDYGMVDGCEERLFKEHRRAPLPFRGDRTMEPNGMYPPVAWTLLWLETYCNRVGV